jgi:hypothetical protein
MSEHNELTAERLREVLYYDPETGVFTWIAKSSSRGNNRVGSIAGDIKPSGYRFIGIDNHRYRAHRLACLYMTNEWPKGEVDHKNGDEGDNRFCNLRDATPSQNKMNTRMRADNKSGFKGVSWSAQNRKWMASIRVNGKTLYIGCFDRREHAANCYHAAALWYFGEYARVDDSYRPLMGLERLASCATG